MKGDPTPSSHAEDARPGAYAGQVLAGRYRIGARLGQGGMGEVYEASHLELPRRFAVKFLRGEHAEQAVLRTRFRREAEAAASLSSEHIVQVFDFGHSEQGTPYLVMERLEGMDLRRFLHRQGTVSWQRAVDIIREACEGAGLAHAQGIVHRDLKPENLFLAQQAGRTRVKLLDFGIAKLRDHATEHGNGKILGTPAYMSPEQARSEPTDQRADVYALGVILFELLTGELPHPGGSQHEILSHLLFQPPRGLAELAPSVPAALGQVVHRAIVSKVDDRFQSATDFMRALSGCCAAEQSGDRELVLPLSGASERPEASAPTVPVRDSEAELLDPPELPAPRRRPWSGSRRAAVVALLAAVALAWFMGSPAGLWAPNPRSAARAVATGAARAQQALHEPRAPIAPRAPMALPEVQPEGGQSSASGGVAKGGVGSLVTAPGKDAAGRPMPTPPRRAAPSPVRPAVPAVAGSAEARSREGATHIEIKQGQQTLLFKRENPLRHGAP
jgi:serine/threonine protein kinase